MERGKTPPINLSLLFSTGGLSLIDIRWGSMQPRKEPSLAPIKEIQRDKKEKKKKKRLKVAGV